MNNRFFMAGLLGFSILIVACSSEKTGSVSYKTEDIQSLAQTVKAEDITMYSTPDCMYCNEAKGWLKQNNFAFTDCDMTTSQSCEQQFHDYHGDGTPLIVVRNHGEEHVMREGFDTDELLLALNTEH